MKINRLKINIIAHGVTETTHDRHIITNYHIINSGKGFSVIDESGIQEVTTGGGKSVYNNIDTKTMGMLTGKHIQCQMLEWFSAIYKQLDDSRNDYYVIGDKFDNRLLAKYL